MCRPYHHLCRCLTCCPYHPLCRCLMLYIRLIINNFFVKNFMFSHHYCQDPISELLNDFLWLMQVQRGAKILYHSATYQEPSLTSCPSLVLLYLSPHVQLHTIIVFASWTGPAIIRHVMQRVGPPQLVFRTGSDTRSGRVKSGRVKSGVSNPSPLLSMAKVSKTSHNSRTKL